ncbi:hypothetical protein CKO13_03960 [Halorhodospira neutriphila]|uniref:Uncharacterized protein n=2 Tax=Halorhodospira neutriphila TaxID=168379 RepID=A0ABS1E4X0_9GAMM|nr:hypothetical protein [Halorhodospira neutriphila]
MNSTNNLNPPADFNDGEGESGRNGGATYTLRNANTIQGGSVVGNAGVNQVSQNAGYSSQTQQSVTVQGNINMPAPSTPNGGETQ